MCRWRDLRRDMVTEIFLLAYVIAWVTVLVVTHLVVQ